MYCINRERGKFHLMYVTPSFLPRTKYSSIVTQNSPLFLRCINSSQELQFHYIVHTCLDFVEEKIIQSNKSGSEVRELYLGLLYSNEEVKA